MPISQESRNVLEEMRKAGVDATILASLERDMDAKPAVDKAVKDGVLAQASFNSYRTKKDQEIQELKNNLTQLSSLRSSAGALPEGEIQQAALERIAALENLFVSQGYELDEVRAEADKLISNPAALKALVDKKDVKVEEKNMPTGNEKYIDEKTFNDTLATAGTNLAVGNIHASAHMARALREADKLGIELDDAKLDGFAPAFVQGLEAGKQPTQIMDEYFGFSAIRAAKAEATRKAELEAAKEQGRQEALKEAGVTIRKSFGKRPTNPILDRQRIETKTTEGANRKDITQEDIDKLPKNSKGDPEYFRLRNFDVNTRRAVHTENATKRWEEASQEYNDDGMYIGNRA